MVSIVYFEWPEAVVLLCTRTSTHASHLPEEFVAVIFQMQASDSFTFGIINVWVAPVLNTCTYHTDMQTVLAELCMAPCHTVCHTIPYRILCRTIPYPIPYHTVL